LCFAFEDTIQIAINGFDCLLLIFECRRQVGRGCTSLLYEDRQILLCIGKGSVRSKEARTSPRVCVNEMPDATAQDSPDEYVGVEDEHLAGLTLPATTQLLEVFNQLFFIDFRQGFG
jgi:hypothetical protein